MRKKGRYLLSAAVLSAALTINTGLTNLMAAAPAADANAEVSSEGADSENPQEPAMPESYEWEIQSNKIAGWPEGPKVVAETAVLMDIDTGQILYAKGIDEKRAPASTTKILTAMLALEQVPFDTQITFTNEVNNIEPGSTHIGIKPGETLTMKDCAYAILLASANEVSSGVAEYIGGTVPAFVDAMNQRAKELGCENTHFVNANGLYSEDHYTTARDLALISKAAFQNETFRDIIKTPYYIVPKTNITDEERWLNNHHKMVLEGANYYEGCLGGKTGYTEKAGNTLVTYAERNGMKLVCVVLADIAAHYDDTRAILDYGFTNFQKLDSAAASLTPAEADSLGSYLNEQGVLNTAFQNASIDVPADVKQEITFRTELENNILNLSYYYGDTALGSSAQEATAEVLAAAEAFDIQQNPPPEDTAEVNTDSADTEEPQPKDETLGGFKNELIQNFQELPNWKYPALILLAAAFIFYVITLIIKIKRVMRKRKRKKLRQQKERKNS